MLSSPLFVVLTLSAFIVLYVYAHVFLNRLFQGSDEHKSISGLLPVVPLSHLIQNPYAVGQNRPEAVDYYGSVVDTDLASADSDHVKRSRDDKSKLEVYFLPGVGLFDEHMLAEAALENAQTRIDGLLGSSLATDHPELSTVSA